MERGTLEVERDVLATRIWREGGLIEGSFAKELGNFADSIDTHLIV